MLDAWLIIIASLDGLVTGGLCVWLWLPVEVRTIMSSYNSSELSRFREPKCVKKYKAKGRPARRTHINLESLFITTTAVLLMYVTPYEVC